MSRTIATSIHRITVQHQQQPQQPVSPRTPAPSVRSLLLWLLAIAAILPSCCLASATGGGVDPFNSTLPIAPVSDDSGSSKVPLASPLAIGVMCGAVVLVCVCLSCCARRQIGAHHTSTRHSGGAGLGSTRTTGHSAQMQARMEAIRRGWRKGDITGGGGSVDAGALAILPGGARESVHAQSLSAMNQAAVGLVLAGSSMGGLGSCRFEHFASDDFIDEPWATRGVIDSLRLSGNILDVVLTAQLSMYLTGLSSLVPLVITVALPFHELILKHLVITDWYGRIERVDFVQCIVISGSALLVHLLAYIAAKRIFDYDRTPSIQRQTQELKAAARIEEQRRIQAAAAATAAAKMVAAVGTGGGAAAAASPTVTRGGSVSQQQPQLSAVAQAAQNGLFLRQGTFASPTAAAAAAAATASPLVAGGIVPAAAVGVASAATAATPLGDDPPLLPLMALCLCSLASYLLLGFLGFIAMDESIGRQYGLTSTPRKLWPPTAGKGPFITFLICVIVGATAMVPIALSLKLLALFKPRHVHPNLMHTKSG